MPLERGPGDTGARELSNPTFHPNILNLSSPLARSGSTGSPGGVDNFGTWTTRLLRGQIKRERNNNGGHTDLYACNFLYNPSTIEVSHSISNDAPPLAPEARDPNDLYNYVFPIGSTLSFSLLFDRTYELSTNRDEKSPGRESRAGSRAGHPGVEVDISALHYIIGVKERTTSNPYYTSPPVPNTVFVRFGGQDSLRYYGYISGLGVTYTHWTQFMVPSRATAAITVDLMPYNYTDKMSTNPATRSRLEGVGTATSHPRAPLNDRRSASRSTGIPQ